MIHAVPFPLETLTVGQLLSLYSGILAELRRRGLVRKNNPPLGDLAEFAAVLAYGGTLAKNSEKSFDVTAADGRRIQVKARHVSAAARPSQTFSEIRSFDFDGCVFILIDTASNIVKSAIEWLPADIPADGRDHAHTKSRVVRTGQIAAAGTDVTERMQNAWTQQFDLVDAAEHTTPN